MTNYSKSAGGFTLTLSVTTNSQSVADNRSSIRRVLKLTYTGSIDAVMSATTFRLTAGSTVSGTVGARRWSKGDSVTLSDTNATVNHGATGSLSLSVSASVDFSTPIAVSGTYTLAKIDRVSSPTLSSTSVNAGTSVTINTNRKSTDLTHTVTYKFGSASGTISSSAGASVSWTPPLSLLSQIPNATSGTCTITVTTKDGSTTIGSKTVSFTLKAPTSVVPSVSSITVVDTVANVVSIVGRYVQGLSRPRATVAGAGIYGSTIKEAVYGLDGQVLDSGATAKTLTKSGTLTVSAHVTDSRGRKSASDTTTISALPYEPPTFQAFDVTRAQPDGTADLEGTSFLLVMDGKVQSLVNGSERNQLVVTVYTRLRGTTAWTTRDSFTHTALRYNTPRVIQGTYPIDESHEVRVVMADRFNQAAAQSTVPTAMILMHWDGSNGVGIGKYRERGMLDIGGDAFARSFNGAKFASPIPLLGVDCDTLIDTGYYQLNNGTAANTPPSTMNGTWEIRVTALESGSVFQTALSFGAVGHSYGEEWVRDWRGTSNGWSAWRPVRRPTEAYSPTIVGGATLGNGSLSGRWEISGGVVTGQVRFNLGSTSAIAASGDLILSAPLPMEPTAASRFSKGRFFDASANAYYDAVILAATAGIYVRASILSSNGSSILQRSITPTVPIPFASGDWLEASFVYPAIV